VQVDVGVVDREMREGGLVVAERVGPGAVLVLEPEQVSGGGLPERGLLVPLIQHRVRLDRPPLRERVELRRKIGAA
jgi:hypothetical protein